MASVEGAVQRINIKQVDPEKNFGKDFKTSVLINNVWYDIGAAAQPKISVKHSQGWHEVAEGDVLEFMCESREYNGKTYWRKKGSIVFKGSGGSPKVASAPSTSRTNTAPVAVKYNGDKGVKIGHAITNAVNICIAKATVHNNTTNLNFDTIEEHAWEVLNLSERMNAEYDQKMSAVNGKAVESKPETVKASATPTVAGKSSGSRATSQNASVSSEDDDGFDDDSVPF